MFTALYVRVAMLLHVVRGRAAAHLRSRQLRFATASPAMRGVTMIEYALLAAVALIVAAIFRSQLSAAFSTVMSKIKGGIENP